MKVLLTGATGFIGSHLWPKLEANESLEVIKLSRAAIPGFIQIPDLCEGIDWKTYLIDVDVVIHLAGAAHKNAASAGGVSSDADDVNYRSTIELAKHAITCSVKKFVFISSIGVHGEFSCGSMITENSKIAPSNEYAASKAKAEQSLQELFENSTAQLVIIRPPLVYGTNAPGNFGTMLKIAASRIPLPFKGICNSRSLVSVNNLVSLLQTLVVFDGDVAGTYIVSDSRAVSTSEVFASLAEGMGQKGKLFYFPAWLLRLCFWGIGKINVYDKAFGNYVVDSSKVSEQLGWRPEFDTFEELKKIGAEIVKK